MTLQFLTRLGVSCAWMHADLSSQSKQQLVDKFQEPSRHGGIRRFRVMVGASRILGQGVTLTRAHRLILMEPSHHAAVEAQNADRTHRLGSMTDRCRFYRFLNPDSRLERMLVLAQQGQRSLHHAVEWMDALAVTDSVAVADEPGLAELMTTPDDWAQDSAGW
jgi:SNF2 family DNA or RNA helicase